MSNPLFVFFVLITYSCKKVEQIKNEEKLSKYDEYIISTLAVPPQITYSCGSIFGGGYGIKTYLYTYPDINLNFSNTSQGSKIAMILDAIDVPNKYTLIDSAGNIIWATPWLGYASVAGPWGSSLNTVNPKPVSFTKDLINSFKFKVETSVWNYADTFNISISCTPPALTIVNTQNSPIYHNTMMKAVDSSFSANQIDTNTLTLLSADNYAKTYLKAYISKAKISISSSEVDSALINRNKIFGINYSENAIFTSRINYIRIADSMVNLSNTSVFMTVAEKTMMHSLFVYFDQYDKGQITYSVMKSNIGSLRNTWNQQGFKTNLHEGDISAYTLNIADSSLSYWNRYSNLALKGVAANSNNVLALPLWVGLDVVGALAGGISSAWDSHQSTGKVNWWSAGRNALVWGAMGSVPTTRWFSRFFK